MVSSVRRGGAGIKLPAPPKRRRVFVVGAGFSAGLNYPLVSDLLIRLWPRLTAEVRQQMAQIIRFHHPNFDEARATTFPNIETLLSEMMVNEQLFKSSRAAPGGFTLPKLIEARQQLLLALAEWFHDLYRVAADAPPAWLRAFSEHVKEQDGVIVSFNWDLVLDQQMFGDDIKPASYGFGTKRPKGAFILKPHGSLNWFSGDLGRKIRSDRRQLLHKLNSEEVYRFTRFRPPKGKQTYMPLIVPPVFNKTFSEAVFTPLWRRCVSVLGTAKEVTFLGYSLPEADLHARFILRCGFDNQREGLLSKDGTRLRKTGEAKVTIVNPDVGAARRIEGVIGTLKDCAWNPCTVERWVQMELMGLSAN